MQTGKPSLLQKLSTNSALVALLVIVVSEVRALIQAVFFPSIDRKVDAAIKSVEPMDGGDLSQSRDRVSRYQNRRRKQGSRRRKTVRVTPDVVAQRLHERRALRGRRASDFSTFGMTHN